MTAEEMFKKLGYSKKEYSNETYHFIEYKKMDVFTVSVIRIIKETFDVTFKEYSKWNTLYEEYEIVIHTSYDILRAINKQIEELKENGIK